MNGVHIRQADGGYIIDVVGRERIATTLEETLAFLVHHFYGIESVTITIHPESPAPQAEPEPDPAQEEKRQ